MSFVQAGGSEGDEAVDHKLLTRHRPCAEGTWYRLVWRYLGRDSVFLCVACYNTLVGKENAHWKDGYILCTCMYVGNVEKVLAQIVRSCYFCKHLFHFSKLRNWKCQVMNLNRKGKELE